MGRQHYRPMPTSAHLADSGGNTFGTTFDLLVRPDVSDDMRCNDLLRKVAESLVVAFPQSSQRAIEDSIVSAIAAADGRFAGLNLNRISSDAGNVAKGGTDGGIYVGRRFVSVTASTAGTPSAPPGAASVSGLATLPIPFGDTNYAVSVEPSADPGSFRWWVISRTSSSLVVGFNASNAVPLTITAQG